MKSKLRFLALLLIAGSVLISCNEMISYPSISDTQTNVYHPGQFVWHDLVSPNSKASMGFYKNCMNILCSFFIFLKRLIFLG